METILITGGTGMIGNALTQALIERGYHVIILTRYINDKPKTKNPVRPGHPGGDKLNYAAWDIEKKTIDKNAIAKADCIIHLAGANFADRRWNEKVKKEILTSRVDSANLIMDSLKTIPNKVKTVISASGVSWYGADHKNGVKSFTEADPPGNDFMAEVCKQWEAAIEPASFLGKRLIRFRIGPVLSKDGGAYVEFRNPMRFGLAGIIGTGKQVTSWIHIDDLVRAILFAMENEKMEGVYNAVAPNPSSNKELVTKIAEKNRGRSFIAVHAPSFALRIIFGEMINEILKSTTVSSAKLQQAGFIFQYPDLESAILQLSHQKNPQV
ncbi:MAG TPA: TIGR01777 family oxidoreductase [Chitinophagaceae bacterium]|nr:TIGR01777 family oxidoreductase [Chitinophagaceae bacterium]